MHDFENIDYEWIYVNGSEYYRRIPDSQTLSASEMPKKFTQTLKDITGDSNLDNYEPADNIIYDSSKGQKCICSHDITKPSFIRYKLNNTVIQVGNECINKLNKTLFKAMKNGTCKTCKHALTDLRKSYAKKGYCSSVCQIKCACGKMKGVNYDQCYRCYTKKYSLPSFLNNRLI